MTENEKLQAWIDIANDPDATAEAVDSVPDPRNKKLVASLLSAAYWHPLNRQRKPRDPHIEGLCEVHGKCQECPRVLGGNGVCWHYSSDVATSNGITKKRLFKVAMDTYRDEINQFSPV